MASVLPNDFVRHLIENQDLTDKRQVRLSRKELILRIEEYLRKRGSGEEWLLIFEEWENDLCNQVVWHNYVARYSPYTETYTIQWLPNWDNIRWATEIRVANLRTEIRENVIQLDYDEFERLIKRVLELTHWAKDIVVTGRTGDGGVDLVGKFVEKEADLELPLIGQAKHWKNKVSSIEIRNFLGSMDLRKKRLPPVGVYVCTGGYTRDAVEAIEKSTAKILSYDLEGFVDLMIKNRAGMSKTNISGYKLDELFWADVRG